MRRATLKDRREFVALWDEYLQELHEQGYTELPSENNLRVYRQYFEDYVKGNLQGETVFWSPLESPDRLEGVIMYGESWSGFEIEHEFDGCCTFWGNYTRPEYRRRYAAIQLREELWAWLQTAPFDGIIWNIPVGLEAAEGCINYSTWGARPVTTQWWYDLRGRKDGTK